MLKFFRRKSSSLADTISMSDFRSIIETHLGAVPESMGFSKVDSCRWVLDCRNGVRKLVELSAHKGAVYYLLWGYSFDSVPHFNSSMTRLNRHRTDKSAILDLFALYRDYSPFCFDQYVSAEEHEIRVGNAVPLFLCEMELFSQESCSCDDLLKICERSRQSSGDFAEFFSHTQMPLVYAYLLNRTGRRKRALSILSQFLEGLEISPRLHNELLDTLEISS